MQTDVVHAAVEVDAIVPVHTPTRPVERAVASIINQNRAVIRVTVVVHNTAVGPILSRLGALANLETVRVLPYSDGIASPSGPFNHGLDHATARWITVLGSDDEFEPGAVDSWLDTARRDGAEAVIARIRLTSGRIDPYPPARLGRRAGLEGRADRLAYRSAPLGLINRERFGTLRFVEGIPSGEDLPYSLAIWFSRARISYARECPGYQINADADDRITFQPRPVAVDFAFLKPIVESEWFRNGEPRDREAVVLKILRIHLFDALLARTESPEFEKSTLPELAGVVTRLVALAPRAEALLSRFDARVIDAVRRGDERLLRTLLSRRDRYASFAGLVSSSARRTLEAQAPFRTLLAGFVASRQGR
ncbi:MAG: glycosyltransferase [Cryobacterium sp.]|nr:glycosyltransferase [Cryobacterium sp.]